MTTGGRDLSVRGGKNATGNSSIRIHISVKSQHTNPHSNQALGLAFAVLPTTALSAKTAKQDLPATKT